MLRGAQRLMKNAKWIDPSLHSVVPSSFFRRSGGRKEGRKEGNISLPAAAAIVHRMGAPQQTNEKQSAAGREGMEGRAASQSVSQSAGVVAIAFQGLLRSTRLLSDPQCLSPLLIFTCGKADRSSRDKFFLNYLQGQVYELTIHLVLAVLITILMRP